jgi:regulator of protease activity HflC (stomatin/prohibitin superfamily)
MSQTRGFFTLVRQSEIGYREFLGMGRTRLEPGPRLALPLLHKIHRVPTNEVGVDIDRMHCYTNENVGVIVTGTLFYRITDAEKACFDVKDYHTSICRVGQSTVRTIIGQFDYDKIIKDRNAVNSELKNIIGETIDCWGVVCTRFEIGDFTPQNDSVAKILEKQMGAERARRENELNTQANVRTAEGEKLAKIHGSDAEFYRVQKLADSGMYEFNRTTEVMINRINQIRTSLPGLTDEQIMTMVLEEKRLEHLKTLAAHPDGKTTYFVDPKSIFPTLNALMNKSS